MAASEKFTTIITFTCEPVTQENKYVTPELDKTTCSNYFPTNLVVGSSELLVSDACGNAVEKNGA